MDKLAEGAKKLGIPLSPQDIEQFEVYYKELVNWNSRMNLTAITNYDDVQVKHFLDSLTLTRAFSEMLTSDARTLIDIGSGAGLPGLPLAIAFPNLKVTLLEATRKKVTFLNHMVEALGLTNVNVVNKRAEEAAHDVEHREVYDVVTARAVAEMPVLMELLLPFCRLNGVVAVPKKGDIAEEVRLSDYALGVLGGRIEEIMPVQLDELTDERVVLRIQKIDETPMNYPRRPGIPEKRPLNGTRK